MNIFFKDSEIQYIKFFLCKYPTGIFTYKYVYINITKVCFFKFCYCRRVIHTTTYNISTTTIIFVKQRVSGRITIAWITQEMIIRFSTNYPTGVWKIILQNKHSRETRKIIKRCDLLINLRRQLNNYTIIISFIPILNAINIF